MKTVMSIKMKTMMLIKTHRKISRLTINQITQSTIRTGDLDVRRALQAVADPLVDPLGHLPLLW